MVTEKCLKAMEDAACGLSQRKLTENFKCGTC